MKPAFERVGHEPLSSCFVEVVERKKRLDFGSSYHYHPEYELIWTVKSKGTRYIGNKVSDYGPDELVFIGKNIPHCWITTEETKQMVVKVKDEFLESKLMDTPEFTHIRKLISMAYRGLQFYGETKTSITKKLTILFSKDPFLRILDLLDILNELAYSREFNFINAEDYKPKRNKKEMDRIQHLYNYIHQNMDQNPSLDAACERLNMTKSTLCKFIKRKTAKTFTQIVNEMRIGKATDLLVDTDHTVVQIAYMTGYNDLSTFFRQFKIQHACSPKVYRQRFG